MTVDLAEDAGPEWLVSSKWIRVFFAAQTVADSKRAVLLREPGRTPVYYFPDEDVRPKVLENRDEGEPHKRYGKRIDWDVAAGERRAAKAAWAYPESELSGHVAFHWNAMGAWFEEDEEVFVHPRDPFKRVDVLQSSRHVQVVVAGETLAETRSPVLLFETGLPTRYYIPKPDVRLDLLIDSERITHCPYKGEAHYYSVRAGDQTVEDLVWYYRYPTPEVGAIANRLCFYNERVDALYVDGERMAKPHTQWSL